MVRFSEDFSPDVVDFCDNAFFPEKKLDFTVSALHFFVKDSIIIGFQQEFSGKQPFEGFKNVICAENYTVQSFFLQKNDYIVEISGKISKFIESLSIFTKKGDFFAVNAQEKASKNSQNFEICVENPWKLRSLFGGLDFLAKKNVWALVYLGFEMNILKETKKNLNFSDFKDDFFSRNAEFITQVQMQEPAEKRGKSAVVLKHFTKKTKKLWIFLWINRNLLWFFIWFQFGW